MRDSIFIDTNLILYSYSATEAQKSEISNRLIFGSENAVISTQVVNEVANILYKKYAFGLEDVESVIFELDSSFDICSFSTKTQFKALKIKQRYGYQYYDSLIIATALENRCSILYSEDMQHNQIIEDKLIIKNPFVDKI